MKDTGSVAVVVALHRTGNSAGVAVDEQRYSVETPDPGAQAEPVAVGRSEYVEEGKVFEVSGEFETCYLGVFGALVHPRKL